MQVFDSFSFETALQSRFCYLSVLCGLFTSSSILIPKNIEYNSIMIYSSTFWCFSVHFRPNQSTLLNTLQSPLDKMVDTIFTFAQQICWETTILSNYHFSTILVCVKFFQKKLPFSKTAKSVYFQESILPPYSSLFWKMVTTIFKKDR